jgi:hypothetical protein
MPECKFTSGVERTIPTILDFAAGFLKVFLGFRPRPRYFGAGSKWPINLKFVPPKSPVGQMYTFSVLGGLIIALGARRLKRVSESNRRATAFLVTSS